MKACKRCRGPFTPKQGHQVHCSTYCRMRTTSRRQAQRRRQARERCTRCALRSCRKVFWTRLTRRVFCADRCRQVAHRRARRECRQAEARIAAREVNG